MRRRRRNRATWFPILGFDTNATNANGLSTVDVRPTSVLAGGGPNVLIIPIIPDIDMPVEAGQDTVPGDAPIRSLRDFVEGQTCIIERIVGNIQHSVIQDAGADAAGGAVIVCSAIAVVPQTDDGQGDPAVNANELDPLRADNSAQPWLWRRVWVLSNEKTNSQFTSAGSSGLPTNNCFGSLAEGSKIDTKGTKRAIRREERIFLIHSFLPALPDNENPNAFQTVLTFADLRVIGRMVRARNRSTFK